MNFREGSIVWINRNNLAVSVVVLRKAKHSGNYNVGLIRGTAEKVFFLSIDVKKVEKL